jgi:hypothetical protein
VLAVVAVVLITPTLIFLVIGSLYNSVSLWTQMHALPQYLSDTFVHGNLGVTGPYNTPPETTCSRACRSTSRC